MSRERETTAKEVLHQVALVQVDEIFSHSRLQLARIYYGSWSPDGLCTSLAEAQAKIDTFDPHQAFAAVDAGGRPLALIHTLLTDAPDIETLTHRFPTYASVEAASRARLEVVNPRYRICFSLTALPHIRLQLDPDSKDISLSEYLLRHLSTFPQKLAYSRLPAVGLHLHFGAQLVAVLENSRPEDLLSEGKNYLLLYP